MFKQNTMHLTDANLSLHDKIHRYGAHSVSDAELISLFLTSRANQDALTLSRSALGHFGSIRALMNADRNCLRELVGFGPAKSAMFQGVLELTRRYSFEELKGGKIISSPFVTRDYLRLCLRDKSYECFFALFLNSKNQVIHQAELFRGTIDSAAVPVREVVKEALKHNAAAMIVAHNHPSGVATPSAADRSLTDTLLVALAMVGVKLLDHFVIGDSEVVSFAEIGALG